MGYTLQIGELETSMHSGDYLEIEEMNSFRQEVVSISHDDAPTFGESTDCMNSRWPSYTSWAIFYRFFDLEELFHDEDYGFLRQHPGCVPITQFHKSIIDDAYEKYKKNYPNSTPGYSGKQLDDVEDDDWPEENSLGARLVWLKYWVDWALKNCEVPAFYNS